MKELKIGLLQQHNIADRKDNMRRLYDGITDLLHPQLDQISALLRECQPLCGIHWFQPHTGQAIAWEILPDRGEPL